MDPTGLPTDNLYKFLALAGLAVAGFCAWLLVKLYWHRSTLRQELELERSRLKGRFETSQALWSMFNAQADGYLAGMGKAKGEGAHGLFREQLLLKQAEMIAEERVKKALKEEAKIVDEKLKHLEMQQPFVLKVRWGLGGVVAIGLIVSVVGFVQWWRHVQYYADRRAKAEYEDKMRELGMRQRERDAQCWKDQHAKPPVPVPSTCPYP